MTDVKVAVVRHNAVFIGDDFCVEDFDLSTNPTERALKYCDRLNESIGKAFAPLLSKARQEGAAEGFDVKSVTRWATTPHRLQAILAFTAGPERQAAYFFEMGREEGAGDERKRNIEILKLRAKLSWDEADRLGEKGDNTKACKYEWRGMGIDYCIREILSLPTESGKEGKANG